MRPVPGTRSGPLARLGDESEKDVNMTSKRPVIATIAVIVLAVALAIGAISASAGNNGAKHPGPISSSGPGW